MATHSSILAWELLWTEEPGGLQSMRSQKGYSWVGVYARVHTHTHAHTHTHNVAITEGVEELSYKINSKN